jgi:2-hydroxy-3-oxopropionate reductase
MGLPVAINLAKAGVDVQGWNRSEAARIEAAAHGVTAVADASQIDASIILVLLPDLPQLQSVLDSGLQSALKAGDTLVVMSTVSPVGIKALATQVAPLGVNVIDAPVSGGVEGAKAATLSIMVGGSPEIFAQLEPTLKKIGKTIKLLGPLGSGAIAKAANQIIVAATITGISEAVTLARRSGVDIAALFELLSGGYAASRIIEVKREKYIAQDYSSMGSAKNQLKDLTIIQEAADAAGIDLPLSKELLGLFTQMIADGNGELDHSGIITLIEKLSDIKSGK